MKEKLVIKDFGPIKSVELELGRFNVLIGEQSTGKSTVAKVLMSIYSLMETTDSSASSLINASELSSLSHFKRKLSVYGIDNYLKPLSIIRYEGKIIRFRLEDGVVFFNYDELRKKDFAFNNLATYIPADRIANTLFSQATWADLIDIKEGQVDLLKYFLRFYSLFNRLKKARKQYDFTEILGIVFRYEDGNDRIILQNGSSITINESASAIQSNLSLLTVIDWQTEERGEEKQKIFVIEEPELHLFPSTIHKVTEFLVDRIMNSGNSIFITTHSPYILTSLNNLIYAYQVGQISSEETEKIIDEKYWLNIDDVSAYRLMNDGTAKNIIDYEVNQIDAGDIDEISRVINTEWDQLLKIEVNGRQLERNGLL